MSDPLISIIAVNIDSPEWAELLIKSIRKFTVVPYETIIVDNGSLDINLTWLRAQADIRLFEIGANLGHGGGADFGIAVARGQYGFVIDIDAHLQRAGWDTDFIALYQENPKTRMIGCIGPEAKPYHPPLFFFEIPFIKGNGITFKYQPDAGPHQTDSFQQSYFDIEALGFESLRIPKGPKVYEGTDWYDQIWINGKPTIAHQWYGTRFNENNPAILKQELDGIKLADHLARKAAFFSEPLVREILEGSDNGETTTA